MWYEGTYSCGHEGRVQLYGKAKEKDWKYTRIFSGICPECQKKEWDKKNQKSVEIAKEFEFPALTGSEKQIAWANTIRFDFYNVCNKKEIIVDDIITKETQSKFWIDNRFYFQHNLEDFLETYHREIEEEKKKKNLLDEDTVLPVNQIHTGVVEIVYSNDKICLHYRKDDDFRDLIEKYHYQWKDGAWCRTISMFSGRYADRAAEIGHALLKGGFAICIHDKEITEKAIKGEFEAECKRWIYSEPDDDLLRIYWRGRDNYLYQEARSIKTSKWNNPDVTVNISEYKEVVKFAEENDFCFTETALEKIEDYKKAIKKARKVDVQ